MTDRGSTWVTRTTSSLANAATLTFCAVYLGQVRAGNGPGSVAVAKMTRYLVAAQKKVRSAMPKKVEDYCE